MLIALLCSTTAWAADYDIWVGGTKVTDANKSNINPSGKSAGTISLVGNTLVFDNVKMTSSNACISVEQSGVTVKFVGSNSLTSSVNVIYSSEDLILDGNSDGTSSVSLTCTSESSHCGIYMAPSGSDKSLNIWNLYVTAKSPNGYALYGYSSGNRAKLYTSCAQISATGNSDRGAVGGFSLWKMYDNGILANKCTYSTTNYRTAKEDGSAANDITLYNGLYVGKAMVRVDATSSKDINPAGKTAGSITYSSKVLTLNGVTYNANTAAFVDNRNVPNLQIELKGTNTISTGSQDVFDIRAHTEFTGSGMLTANGQNGISIFGNTKVTVNVNNEVHFNGTGRGYYGYHNATDRPNCDLILVKAGDNSDYYFKGEANGAIVDASHLTLTDMDFYYSSNYGTPACYFDPIDHRVETTGGTLVKDTDVNFYRVNTTYPIWIGGVQVTECNKNSIGSPYLTAGTVKYEAGGNNLTLTGATIEVTDNSTNAICIGEDAGDINIKFDGTTDDADKQYLTANADAIDLGANTTFTGSSKFYIASNNKSGITTRYGACVTFNTTAFAEVKGAEYGYYGNGATTEKLTLKKATGDKWGYRFVGEQGIIHGVTELVLDNMDFWQGYSGYLSGCYFDEKKLMQNDEEAKGQIAFGAIVEKLPVWVMGKQLNKVSDNPDYTIYVGSPYITSGAKSIGYNPFDNTLTLNNATVDCNPASEGNYGIIQTDGNTELTINIVGTNDLKATNCYTPLWFSQSKITIQGDGNLNLWGKYDDLYSMNDNSLTITGKVNLEAQNMGIGSNNDGKELIIGGEAVVKAKHISRIKDLILKDDHDIASPVGAVFDNTAKAITLGGNVAQDVVIMKVEDYGLFVCELGVTSSNCTDILGDGKFKYDPESKTLTITEAHIDNTDISDVVINDDVDGLKINFVGDNSFKVGDNIFQLYKSTTITGTGTVTGELAAEDGFGIWYKADLDITLDGATFQFKGFKGVSGFYDATVNMTINSGKFIFEPASSDGMALEGLASLTLGTGMDFAEPVGGRYDTGLQAVTVDGTSKYEGKVVIEGATAYDLTIGGKVVNDHNCSDVFGNGVFKYDDATKTLTVNGNFEYEGRAIVSSIPDLTIKVAGASKLTQKDPATSIIRLYAATTITGGKLTLDSPDATSSIGIYIEGGDLTIKDADIEIIGDNFQYGITGDNNNKLIIDNSDITARASGAGVYVDWDAITLTNCYIDEPRPSQILPFGIADGEGTIVGSGSEVATVVIKAGDEAVTYALTIEGKPVTSKNCADVLGNGVFSYDNVGHILTLKGEYTSTYTDYYVIVSNIPEGLTIQTDGPTTLNVHRLMRASTPIIIDGCKLKVNLTDGGLGLYAWGADMTIKDSQLEFTGESVNYSITGDKDSKLLIDNSDITAVGQNYGTIADWQSITLANCFIDTPRPSKIATFEGGPSVAITNEDGNAKVNVVIKTGADAIENVNIAEKAPTDIYDVAGRKLNETRRGINIVRTDDGKVVKVLKK